MSLRKMCDEAAAMAKGLKEDEVAGTHVENRVATSINPVIQGWRGLAPVVVMFPVDVDRDQALRAAFICATGFGCDTIAMTTDAWTAASDTNPVTGKDWRQGEMQDVVHNHQGIEKGWIKESLTTQAVNRAGDVAGTHQGYTATMRRSALGIVSWSLVWDEAVALGVGGVEGSRNEGLIVRELVAYMNRRTSGQFLASLGVTGAQFGLDEVEAQAHADCAIVKALTMAGFEGAVMLMSDDDRRAKILDESLGHMRPHGL